jgi:hypothetical protein
VATTAAQQMFQRALMTSLGPGTRKPPKDKVHGKKSPTQNLAKQHQTDQELTSNTTTQKNMD